MNVDFEWIKLIVPILGSIVILIIIPGIVYTIISIATLKTDVGNIKEAIREDNIKNLRKEIEEKEKKLLTDREQFIDKLKESLPSSDNKLIIETGIVEFPNIKGQECDIFGGNDGAKKVSWDDPIKSEPITLDGFKEIKGVHLSIVRLDVENNIRNKITRNTRIHIWSEVKGNSFKICVTTWSDTYIHSPLKISWIAFGDKE